MSSSLSNGLSFLTRNHENITSAEEKMIMVSYVCQKQKQKVVCPFSENDRRIASDTIELCASWPTLPANTRPSRQNNLHDGTESGKGQTKRGLKVTREKADTTCWVSGKWNRVQGQREDVLQTSCESCRLNYVHCWIGSLIFSGQLNCFLPPQDM